GNVPQFQRAVFVRRGQDVAVGTEREAAHRPRAFGQGGTVLVGADLPPVYAAGHRRREDPIVGREGQVINATSGSPKPPDELAGREVPEPNRVVGGGRG